jgi:hypothetical protein
MTILNLSTELRPVPTGRPNANMIRLAVESNAVTACAATPLCPDTTHAVGTIEGGAVFVTYDGSDPDVGQDNGHKMLEGSFVMARQMFLNARFIGESGAVRVKVSQFTMG